MEKTKEKSKLLLSVVIALYNAKEEIKICLDSIFNSDWDKFEVIVVDDCSTDGSLEVAKKYPCKIFSTEKRSGPARARNIGVEKSNSDIVLFLDSDTEVGRDSLRLFYETFKEKKEIVAVIAIPSLRSLRKGRAPDYNALRNQYTLASANPIGDYFTTQMGAVRKDEFLKVGGFDEKYTDAGIEDIEFGMRLPKNSVYINKKIIIKHHFPYFGSILNKYFQRAEMLTEVLKRKKRLASAHANKKGMFSVLTAILTIPFLLLSIFLPVFLIGLFALFLAFIILSSGLLYYGAKKRGPIYVFEAIFFEYFFSLAIGFGGISISFKQYTKKVKNFFWKYLNLFRMFITGRPTYLIFYVTSICNSRCKMCFNWKYNNSKSIKNEFTLEEIYRFSKKAGYLQYVTLGGGEPFLRKDIDEICRIFYENSHTEIFSIPTNCMNPEFIRVKTRKMLEKCPNAIFRISMSIDGIGDLHDFIRGVKGNFKKVEETYKVLRKLREEYPNLEILANTTFSIYNQDKIKEIHDFIKKNFRTDMYGLTLVRGNTRNLVSKNIDLGKYEKAIKIFENEYFNNKGEKRHPLQRLLTILPIFTRREVLKTAVSQKRTYDCYAISKFVVVDSFGNVFACEMLPNKLGDLRKENYDLKKILDKLENKRLKHYIKNKGCNCTWECAIQNSTVFNYGKYPTMFYEAFVK